MEGVKYFSIVFIAICLTSGFINATPAQNHLRQLLRRSIRAGTARIEPAACVDNPQCATSPSICDTDPDLAEALCPVKCGTCVCEDHLATEGSNCTTLAPDICSGDLAATICPKTCGICGGGAPAVPCGDHITGISCASLPNPCNDELGKVACPKFCGFCVDGPATQAPSTSTSTPAPTVTLSDVCAQAPCLNGGSCTVSSDITIGFVCACPAPFTGAVCQSKTDTTIPTTQASTAVVVTSADGACSINRCLNGGGCVLANTSYGFRCQCPVGFTGTICESTTGTTQSPVTTSCPVMLKDQRELPCQAGEVVFMIEYSYKDTGLSVDHEGDFIKELVDAWRIKDTGIRIGVVIYHDTVSEVIHITDFANDPARLKARISSLTRRLRPSGSSDLAKALDFVRQNSFTNARPDVIKTVIPIVHQMSAVTKANIVPAAQRLKDECVSIVGIAVVDSTLDSDILHQAVSQPYQSFYSSYRTFTELENSGQFVHYFYPGCSSNGNN